MDDDTGRQSDTVNTPAISADGVTHAYRRTIALDCVSFSVARGALFGLLGPNGSGKTTLFRLLSTLLPLNQGRVTLMGVDLQQQPMEVRRRIGVTFQSPAVDVRLTVSENLLCHAAIYGLKRHEARRRVTQLLERFRLADRGRTLVGSLSGGLKRRVELAKGLLHKPQVLLLDEPTTGLDVLARMEFFQLLQELRQEDAVTVVMATHLMEEAEHCDDLLLMDQGRIVAQGSPDVLKSSLSGDRLTVRCRNVEAARPELEAMLQCQATQVGSELVFPARDPVAQLPSILQRFGSEVLSVQVARPSLEDVFLSRTGRLLSVREEQE